MTMGWTKSEVVTRISLPTVPSRPPDTLQPSVKQTCCRELSPEGARTINLLSAAAGLLHTQKKTRRTHNTFGFMAYSPSVSYGYAFLRVAPSRPGNETVSK